jgi:lysophospholipase L1-like esterase
MTRSSPSYRVLVRRTAEPRTWRRYAALGDSFTEGMMDVIGPTGRHRGWADLVAGELAARAATAGHPGIDYANLAVRGRLIRQVVREQVPPALLLGPDLTTLAVGVNDSLRRRFDVDSAATDLENAVRDLRLSGSDVLVFSFGDPSRRSRVMAGMRDRIRAYDTAVEAIAERYQCFHVDYWGVAAMDDDVHWDADRLHLSPAGHLLAARSVLAALGLADDSWRTPMVASPRPPLHRRVAADGRWIGDHLVPWALRRARGASSGDGIQPKHPTWVHMPGV